MPTRDSHLSDEGILVEELLEHSGWMQARVGKLPASSGAAIGFKASWLSLGVSLMSSSKTVVISAVLSVLILTTSGTALYFYLRPSDEVVKGEVPGSEVALPTDAGDTHREERGGEKAALKVQAPPPEASANAGLTPETLADPLTEPLEGIHAASAPALAIQKEYDNLRERFKASNWAGIRDQIASIRRLLADGGDEALDEILALVDEESDASFLEAFLYYLGSPYNGKEDREALEHVLADQELQNALWERFEDESDPALRAATLAFFDSNPRLRAKRVDGFMEVGRYDVSEKVRSKAIGALAPLWKRPDVQELLFDVAENEADENLRSAAIQGLAKVKTERARSIVHAALGSDSERVRSAVLEAQSAREFPHEVTGGEVTKYLSSEFRSAQSQRYKSAVVDQMLEISPETLTTELTKALSGETDTHSRKYYQALLELVEGGVSDPEDAHHQLRPLYNRFRYAEE